MSIITLSVSVRSQFNTKLNPGGGILGSHLHIIPNSNSTGRVVSFPDPHAARVGLGLGTRLPGGLS